MKKLLTILLLVLLGCVAIGAQTAAGADNTGAATVCPMMKIEAERLPDLNIPRGGHALFYAGGEIVAAGGRTSGFVPTATAEYYKDGKWHLMQMVYEHDDGFFVPMKSGKVLIGGGHEKNLGIGQTFAVESYDPATHTFKGFGCLDTKRSLACALELDSSQVVIAGNWYADDNIEIFDGKKNFSFVRNVSVGRSVPYVFRIAKDDAIIFGDLGTKGEKLTDTVADRLRGEPIGVPLLKTWQPLRHLAIFNSDASFIGDESQDDYRYLLPVQDAEGQIAVALVKGTEFSLLPTTSPVPMEGPWGQIEYLTPFVVDRQLKRGYMLGWDKKDRVYVLSVDYRMAFAADGTVKEAAPLTLFYTDPLPTECLSMPVLTPEGHLLMAGGATTDNFEPFSAAYLLRMDGTGATLAHGTAVNWVGWLLAAFVLIGLLLLVLSRRKKAVVAAPVNEIPQENIVYADDNEHLMQRIRTLMSEQQLFLHSELKLTDVAAKLNTNSRYVSDAIKAQCGCSFSQFVNGYRIDYAKHLLRRRPDKKVTSVYMEAGFSNETSFFRAFKAITGMTPGEWVGQEDE